MIDIDVRGTSTDFVVVRTATPHDPSEGLLTGLHDVAVVYQLTLPELLVTTEIILHQRGGVSPN